MDDRPWRSRRVELRQLTEADLPFFHELATSLAVGRRFVYGGAGVSAQQFAATVWDGALRRLVVVGRRSRQRLGVVSITSPDLRNGTAYASVVGDADAFGSGLVAEGLFLGIEYAFDTWPLRKIYGEVPHYNFARFRSGDGKFFAVEGRLTRHVFMGGDYHDVLVLAVDRERWMKAGAPFARRLRRHGEAVATRRDHH